MNVTIPQKPSDAWRAFTLASTAASLIVVGALIFFTQIDVMLKVAFGVSVAWALHNAVNTTKLLRDRSDFEAWQQSQAPEPRRTAPSAAKEA